MQNNLISHSLQQFTNVLHLFTLYLPLRHRFILALFHSTILK